MENDDWLVVALTQSFEVGQVVVFRFRDGMGTIEPLTVELSEELKEAHGS